MVFTTNASNFNAHFQSLTLMLPRQAWPFPCWQRHVSQGHAPQALCLRQPVSNQDNLTPSLSLKGRYRKGWRLEDKREQPKGFHNHVFFGRLQHQFSGHTGIHIGCHSSIFSKKWILGDGGGGKRTCHTPMENSISLEWRVKNAKKKFSSLFNPKPKCSHRFNLIVTFPLNFGFWVWIRILQYYL